LSRARIIIFELQQIMYCKASVWRYSECSMFLVRWKPSIYVGHSTFCRVYAESLQWCAESFQRSNTLLYCQLCWHYTR